MERELYDYFLDTEDLMKIMPNATGVWLKDKKEFLEKMKENDDLLKLEKDEDEIFC